MSNTLGSTRSESSSDIYLPRVTNRRTLADYDKCRSYRFREIADVYHINDSSGSEDNCKDDQKKRNKIKQNVKKSKKTKLSDQTKPSNNSELNEILVEDDITTNRPRGQNGLFISKNPENAKDTRSKMCANLDIVGENRGK